MKTVWDAVNEFKGEWPEWECIVEIELLLYCKALPKDCKAKVGCIEEGGNKFNPYYFSEICSIKEFNALLAEMETNFGKYTGAKFDASKATELEPSKVDIDWNEAPEGATHLLGCGGKSEFATLVGGKYFECDDEDTEFIMSDKWWSVISTKTTEQQPPVYTQEMHDNGELPNVGDEVLLVEEVNLYSCAHDCTYNLDADDKVVVVSVGVRPDNGCTIITVTNNKGFATINPDYVKPLPPKQELIDGKAYQFENNFLGKDSCGVYRETNNSFYNCWGGVCS